MSAAELGRDRLISFRALALVILGLGVIRLLVALLIPKTPSPLAPDEGTYAALAAVVASGGDWVSWSNDWGASLYPGGRALMGPAALLVFAGLDEFTAVRQTSVAYAIGSQLLLLALARLARQRLAPTKAWGLPLFSWPLVGLAVFVFLPSNVVWSNLGLREAACTFWALAAVTSTAYLFRTRDWHFRIAWGVAIAISTSMAFQSRIYLAAALVLALAVGIVWLGRERPRVSLTLATAVLLGAVIGVALSSPATPPTDLAQTQAPTSQPGVPAVNPGEAETSPGTPGPDQSPGLLPQVEETVRAAQERLNPDNYVERGSIQREASAQSADSALAVDSCTGSPDGLALRWCEITRIPGAALAVMFRPLWPLDAPAEWSALAVLASIENVLWIAIVAAAAWVLVSRRLVLPRVAAIGITYGALVVAGMAALEGNLGTAFRHKSNVLWVLCLILVVAGDSRRISDRPTRKPASTAEPLTAHA